jgi:hypothetical protein
LGERGRTTHIPEEIRVVVLAYVQEGRCSGETWAAIAQNVGLSQTGLQRWLRKGKQRRPSRLRPVVVSEDDLPRSAAGLTLTTAYGEKLEGLGVDDAIRLVRALR